MRRRLFRLALLLTSATVVLMLGGVWWWALLGMTIEVGQAIMLTTFVMAAGAAVTWGAWTETK